MGLRPRHKISDLNGYADRLYLRAEAKMIEIMQFVGEQFIRDARSMSKTQGSFGDITGNLRSSIGYFIVKDGRIITETVYEADKGTDRRSGVSQAKKFARDIKQSGGLYLYGVAGMEYAEEVESRGANVISLQADSALIDLEKLVRAVS